MSAPNMIRVFNLTDVETTTLKQAGLMNATIAVARVVVSPGEMVETGEDELILEHLAHFIMKGALAVGSLPASYVMAKEQMPKPAPIVAPMAAPVEAKKDKKEK